MPDHRVPESAGKIQCLRIFFIIDTSRYGHKFRLVLQAAKQFTHNIPSQAPVPVFRQNLDPFQASFTCPSVQLRYSAGGNPAFRVCRRYPHLRIVNRPLPVLLQFLRRNPFCCIACPDMPGKLLRAARSKAESGRQFRPPDLLQPVNQLEIRLLSPFALRRVKPVVPDYRHSLRDPGLLRFPQRKGGCAAGISRIRFLVHLYISMLSFSLI